MLPLPSAVAETLDDLLARALDEDIGPGDVTTLATVPAGRQASARFLAKENGVLAGLAVAERAFAAVDPNLTLIWSAADGDAVSAGTVFGRVTGTARSILTAERLALNLLQRMSGVATAAHRMAEAAYPAVVLDTRKTVPGLRALDKWAVRLGGAENHRTGLFDMVLIKDNHIAAAGSIGDALRAAHAYLGAHDLDLPIEVETRTLDEVDAALGLLGDGLRVDRLLLDNMTTWDGDRLDTTVLETAVQRVGGRCATEASGNVTLQSVAAIAQTGVDYISSGALTHSVIALDVSLKIALA